MYHELYNCMLSEIMEGNCCPKEDMPGQPETTTSAFLGQLGIVGTEMDTYPR